MVEGENLVRFDKFFSNCYQWQLFLLVELVLIDRSLYLIFFRYQDEGIFLLAY